MTIEFAPMTMQIITRQEAVQLGLSRYFTGKPCKHGHIAERLTRNHCCSVCANERAKAYQKKIRDSSQTTVKGNPKHEQPAREAARQEAIKAGAKTYFHGIPCKRGHVAERQTSNGMCMECAREKNSSEKMKAYKKQHKKENAQRYKDNDREYKKKWKKKNPDYFTKYAIKRSTVLQKATPSWADLSAVTTKYKERECMNGLTGVEHHVDHIIPLQGKNVCGLHVASNLRVILARDNLSKSNKHA